MRDAAAVAVLLTYLQGVCNTCYAFDQVVESVPSELAKGLSNEDFQQKYGDDSLPVHLKGGALHWPAQQWTLDSLRAKCGDSLLNHCNGEVGIPAPVVVSHLPCPHWSESGG